MAAPTAAHSCLEPSALTPERHCHWASHAAPACIVSNHPNHHHWAVAQIQSHLARLWRWGQPGSAALAEGGGRGKSAALAAVVVPTKGERRGATTAIGEDAHEPRSVCGVCVWESERERAKWVSTEREREVTTGWVRVLYTWGQFTTPPPPGRTEHAVIIFAAGFNRTGGENNFEKNIFCSVKFILNLLGSLMAITLASTRYSLQHHDEKKTTLVSWTESWCW